MEVEQSVWGFTPEGEAIILYTMRNESGATVQLTNLGASVVSVCVPDRQGVLADVVLGYKEWKSYLNDGPYLGKCVGRFANRIGNARFVLDGKEYRLSANCAGGHHIHGGGTEGFANKVWESRVETDRVVFSLFSPDGDQGYPGAEPRYPGTEPCRPGTGPCIRAERMAWGFPRFDGKGLIINARAESVRERPAFRDSVEQRRCVILARGFYEWNRSREKFTYEREDLADGTVVYHVNTSGLLQRYTFTEI